MGKSACWHPKRGMAIYAPVTLAPWGKEKGLLGLANHQPSTRLSQRPCLKGLRQRVSEQDSRSCTRTLFTYNIHVPPSYRHTHTRIA